MYWKFGIIGVELDIIRVAFGRGLPIDLLNNYDEILSCFITLSKLISKFKSVDSLVSNSMSLVFFGRNCIDDVVASMIPDNCEFYIAINVI